jgi:hypothetical protein
LLDKSALAGQHERHRGGLRATGTGHPRDRPGFDAGRGLLSARMLCSADAAGGAVFDAKATFRSCPSPMPTPVPAGLRRAGRLLFHRPGREAGRDREPEQDWGGL